METSQNKTTSKAESALAFINEQKAAGRALYIRAQGPYTTTYKITPATFAKWAKAGNDLFKMDKSGNLLMAQGKNFNIIVSRLVSYVSIKAE